MTSTVTPLHKGPNVPDVMSADSVRCYPIYSRNRDRVTVATLLDVGKDKAYALVNSGALPAVLVGGERRVRHTALLRYLATRPEAPTT